MRRFLQRLLKGPRARGGGVICYLRENGPIAYELPLFSSDPRARADAMLSSEPAWAWRSPARGWTELTRVSLPACLSDLTSGEGLLLGLEGDPPPDLGDGVVKAWSRGFLRLQPSPVAAVLSVGGGRQCLFVQQHASDAVNRLLETWDVDKRAAERRAYARLGPASLESITDRL